MTREERKELNKYNKLKKVFDKFLKMFQSGTVYDAKGKFEFYRHYIAFEFRFKQAGYDDMWIKIPNNIRPEICDIFRCFLRQYTLHIENSVQMKTTERLKEKLINNLLK